METSELIKEAKQGSVAAQKYLFDNWCERMMVVCRRYVKSAEDAEELMLDGFLNSLKIFIHSLTRAMRHCTIG